MEETEIAELQSELKTLRKVKAELEADLKKVRDDNKAKTEALESSRGEVATLKSSLSEREAATKTELDELKAYRELGALPVISERLKTYEGAVNKTSQMERQLGIMQAASDVYDVGALTDFLPGSAREFKQVERQKAGEKVKEWQFVVSSDGKDETVFLSDTIETLKQQKPHVRFELNPGRQAMPMASTRRNVPVPDIDERARRELKNEASF